MSTKKILAAVALTVFAASVALAAGTHFQGTPTETLNATANGTSVTVCGSLAGLGNQDVTVQLTAQVVSYCTNKGGNIPPGQSETLSGQVSNLQPKNGSLSFCVSTGNVTAKCPGNQRPTTQIQGVTLNVIQGGQVVLTQSF